MTCEKRKTLTSPGNPASSKKKQKQESLEEAFNKQRSAAISEKLKKLSSEIKEAVTARKKKSAKTPGTEKNARKKKSAKTPGKEKNKIIATPSRQSTPLTPRNRIPPGFSCVAGQKRGKLPMCQGCMQQIDRDQVRVRHSWIDTKKKHTRPTRVQYHANAECLLEMREDHLMQFMEDSKLTLKMVVSARKEIKRCWRRKNKKNKNE